MKLVNLISLILCMIMISCTPKKENIIKNLSPLSVQGVLYSEKINDGKYGFEGSSWNGSASAIFESASSSIVYDLGGERWINSLSLQGDNNDEMLVSISLDEQFWRPLWKPQTHNISGLRKRWVNNLQVKGRYLKISIISGDGSYAVSEFEVEGY